MGEGTWARRGVDPSGWVSSGGGWERQIADPMGFTGSDPVAAPPVPPPPVVRDETDSVDTARLRAQRMLSSVRGFRRAFLTPRGPGGPQWQAPETPQQFTRAPLPPPPPEPTRVDRPPPRTSGGRTPRNVE